MLSAVAMKYTVSNNIVIASGSRTLSISAGQQSRILATRLACFKFEQFMRLQHEEIVTLVGSSRGNLTDRVAQAVHRASTLGKIGLERTVPIVMASDGFIPFKDNIEEASQHGIDVIWEPEGGLRRKDVELAVANHAMTLLRTQHRFFYH
jgi:phosphoribosylaminoimidazolecarboxamide formyltransferase/IMP cyclohydrolase